MVEKKDNWEIIIENGQDKIFAETYRDKQTDGPWYKIGDTTNSKELTDTDRKILLTNSRDRYWKTPEGRCLIGSAVHYIIGKGIIYHADDENLIVQEKIDEFWKNPLNLMELRQKEIIRRTLRDGEIFIRFFEDLNGMSYLRFVEPEEITDIERNSDDAETIINYKREWIPADETSTKVEMIPADDIVHIKLNVDMNMKRGRPYIENVIKRLIQLEQFIEGRSRKNRIGAGNILEKIIHGKGAIAEQVSSISSGMSDADLDSGQSTASKKMPKLGSVIIHNEAIEYKWCDPKINADDCKEDARLIKLSICAGVNAPEFILADSSNANYSSTLVSENPYVRSIEDFQDTFEVYFQIIFRKVIEKLIAKKVIPATSTETTIKESWVLRFIPFKKIREALDAALQTETTKAIPTKTTVSIEFPQMIHKELKNDTEAYQIHSMMNWASDETLAGKLGYNYEEEKQKINKRKAEEGDSENSDYSEEGYDKERQAEIDKEDNANPEKK